MAVEPKLMTADELLTLSTGGSRHELVGGVLRTMAPTGQEHGGIEVVVSCHFLLALAEQPIGRVVGGEAGFRLRRDPDTVRGADVAFIHTERLPGGIFPTGYFEGAPDLAVEIISPNDTASEVDENVREWLAAGARAVWVIYPVGPSLVVHLPDGTARRHLPEDRVEGGDAFPGFRMRLKDLVRPPGA